VAVTRRGSWVHVIAAHDRDTLRTKIEAAQREGNPDRTSLTRPVATATATGFRPPPPTS